MEKYLEDFIKLCDDLAWGRPTNEDSLFELTQSSKVSKEINKLAEAFGLMLVKVAAREYHKEQLIETLQQQNLILEEARKLLKQKNMQLLDTLSNEFNKNMLIGQDEYFLSQVNLALNIAKRPINTLILGPTGSGKEVIAKTIHYNSPRKASPFIAINCTAIPETLFESTFFGIEKGVATGVSERKGLFEEAHTGTLFLDEIADMSLANQAKLLRVLEDRKITRLGSSKSVEIDFLLLSASHQNFHSLIEEGKFREDLFYRINIVEIKLPALKDRGEDILLLAKHFLNKHAKQMFRNELSLNQKAREALLLYSWHGNIRELNNEMERAAALSALNLIDFFDLSPKIQNEVAKSMQSLVEFPVTLGNNFELNLPENLQDAETKIILNTLNKCNNNKSQAAKMLGITREGLRKKLLKLNI